jgi:large subunit ribosomal protein L17
MALLQHERIVTTIPKAKAVRPFAERLITLAVRAAKAMEATPENPEPDKAAALHYRRLATSAASAMPARPLTSNSSRRAR